LIDTANASSLIQFVLKGIHIHPLKKSSIHKSVGITMGDPAHHKTDEVMGKRERGIRRVR
jgi:hypothetical protein